MMNRVCCFSKAVLQEKLKGAQCSAPAYDFYKKGNISLSPKSKRKAKGATVHC